MDTPQAPDIGTSLAESRETVGPLLSAQAVADMLSVTPRTVRALVRSGALAGYRISGRLRFKADDVVDFLQASAVLGGTRPGVEHA